MGKCTSKHLREINLSEMAELYDLHKKDVALFANKTVEIWNDWGEYSKESQRLLNSLMESLRQENKS